MKVAQPVKSYRCEDCANEYTDICDRCMGLNEAGAKPSNWKSKFKVAKPPVRSKWMQDCDEGRICPICGKVMILGEDEKTYYQKWECDGCGYMEED